MRDDARGFLFEMLEMTAGPILWFVHLLVVYGAAALYCARPQAFPESGATLLLVGSALVTLTALGTTAFLLLRAWRELSSPGTSHARVFVDRVSVALCVFALVAITWTALPVAIAPSCREAPVSDQRSS